MRNPFRYFNSSHPAIRRAGRLGDGWLIEVFRVAAADAQRDPAALGIDATVYLNDGDIEGWTKEAEAWSSLGLPQSPFESQILAVVRSTNTSTRWTGL